VKKSSADAVEKRFPNAAARKAADEAIVALGPREDMRAYIDVWEAAYHEVAKKSPWRKK
jgi:hypothetical protein